MIIVHTMSEFDSRGEANLRDLEWLLAHGHLPRVLVQGHGTEESIPAWKAWAWRRARPDVEAAIRNGRPYEFDNKWTALRGDIELTRETEVGKASPDGELDDLGRGPRSDTISYWILAARSDRYRLLDSVRQLDEDWWRTGGRRLSRGDRVAIWKYKSRDAVRGIVGFGEVMTDPKINTIADSDHPFWVPSASPMPAKAERVLVRYVVRPDPPLWLEESPPASVIRRLSVVGAQGGTAFHISPDEWDQLMALVGGWPTDSLQAFVVATEAVIEAASRATGQGIGLTASERACVERHAMAVVRAHLEAAHWAVMDTSKSRPYDLRATRGRERRLVEVKGTTGLAGAVFLTKNEVQSAKATPGEAMLAVVSEIELDRAERPPVAFGGQLTILEPWNPEDAYLTPIVYRYYLPADLALSADAAI